VLSAEGGPGRLVLSAERVEATSGGVTSVGPVPFGAGCAVSSSAPVIGDPVLPLVPLNHWMVTGVELLVGPPSASPSGVVRDEEGGGAQRVGVENDGGEEGKASVVGQFDVTGGLGSVNSLNSTPQSRHTVRAMKVTELITVG
jgi:hypothetical protein